MYVCVCVCVCLCVSVCAVCVCLSVYKRYQRVLLIICMYN